MHLTLSKDGKYCHTNVFTVGGDWTGKRIYWTHQHDSVTVLTALPGNLFLQ
jgi:hypothetical protein